jgi:hypothetical protein
MPMTRRVRIGSHSFRTIRITMMTISSMMMT